MADDLRITEISADRVDSLEPLWAHLLHHHHDVAPDLGELGRKLTDAESWAIRRAQYLEWFAAEHGRAFLATRDGHPIGYCYVHISTGSGSWYWGATVGVLETLVVAPGERGSGLGTQLMELGLQVFRDAGLDNMKVTVIAGNTGAARLYERMGAVPALITYALRVPGA